MGGHREIFGEVMLELDHGFAYISGHGKVYFTVGVIPFKMDPTVQGTGPISRDRLVVIAQNRH